MTAAGTALIYGLLGAVVAAGLARRLAPRRLVVWAVFWPLFAPLLFGPTPGGAPVGDVATAREALTAAFADLPPPARAALRPEVDRVLALTGSLAALARGLAEMDAVLATSAFDRAGAEVTAAALEARGCPIDDPRVRSVAARMENIDRLHALRERRAADLERALLTLQALVSEVRLLACAGAELGDAPLAIAQVAELVRTLAETLFAPDEALV